ncbi:MAG: hypothetical protein ABJA50_04045 [Chloroflexota bacterium]
MRSRGKEEALRAENEQLRELLAQALARIEALEAKVQELEQALTQALTQAKSEPPSFIKASTRKKEQAEKKPRRKRAKDQNGARRRETPTQTIQHKVEQCPESTKKWGYRAWTQAIKSPDVLCRRSRSAVDRSQIPTWDALRPLIPPTF